jgi:hypothetical protein
LLDMSQTNPVACLLAASVGIAEVFKKLIAIPADIAPVLINESFSLFELTSEFAGIGPAIPEEIELPPTLQVGAGAIGNGVALVLPDLGAKGRWHIVDKQPYAFENLGTCVLVEKDGWVGKSKAEMLSGWLRNNSSMTATGEQALIKDALGGASVCELKPRAVLNGLDDVQARHDSQLAWPDLLLDGGINDVGAAVFQHRDDSRRLACIRCGFALPTARLSKTIAELTGLTDAALADPDKIIDDSHVDAAPPELKVWLSSQRGKSVCSVLGEAALAHLGVPSHDSFRPSVPFVATGAAALMVAELLKALLYPEREYIQRFTMGNLFLGASHSAGQNSLASPDCLCIRQRDAISAWKSRRA